MHRPAGQFPYTKNCTCVCGSPVRDIPPFLRGNGFHSRFPRQKGRGRENILCSSIFFDRKAKDLFSKDPVLFSTIGREGFALTIKMYFGIIARKKRKEFGLSQEKVAEYAGMTTQMYREIEKGKRSTAWEKWLIICAVLRIGVEDMLRLQECLLAEDEGKAELMKWLKAKQASETAGK